MKFPCPVCGYRELPEAPQNFSICPSCGTEFGYDDAKFSHIELRRQWIKDGAIWFSRARPHAPTWNPWIQLHAAGFAYAIPYRVSMVTKQEPATSVMFVYANEMNQFRLVTA